VQLTLTQEVQLARAHTTEETGSTKRTRSTRPWRNATARSTMTTLQRLSTIYLQSRALNIQRETGAVSLEKSLTAWLGLCLFHILLRPHYHPWERRLVGHLTKTMSLTWQRSVTSRTARKLQSMLVSRGSQTTTSTTRTYYVAAERTVFSLHSYFRGQ